MWLDNLRAMKEQSGMTTKEISAKSGIPEPTLEKLFAGATKDPKLTTMQQLVHFFGHTLDDLDDPPVSAKKSPSTAEAAPGEDHISLEESNRLLVALGFIEEGQDLSDDDLAFLEHVIGLLDAWFGERK